MGICVIMCVWVHAYILVCGYAFMCVDVQIYACVYLYESVCVFAYTCVTCMSVDLCISIWRLYTHIPKYMYELIRIVWVGVGVRVYVCQPYVHCSCMHNMHNLRAYVYTYMYTCAYIYTIYTHTHTRAYISMCICALMPSCLNMYVDVYTHTILCVYV